MYALFIVLTFVSHNCAGHIATEIFKNEWYMNLKNDKLEYIKLYSTAA